MATSKSAKKRIRTIEKKTAINNRRRSQIKTVINKFEEAVESNNVELAQERLNEAKKVIDKAASNGTIHKNNAARKKSKLDKMLNNLSA